MLNLLINTPMHDPLTPAYMRALWLAGDCTGMDLACILDVTEIVIRPEWDRVTFVQGGIIA